ncbi:MAG: hypothetical protein PG981_000573 [Wolbachia endosymbiont of Ctenocephalides orientis wCori]|nr:MAG: hypothetical protein PG981_000573 [Wolbachia endosymbiont of Ctenocephalides orientis wCori]
MKTIFIAINRDLIHIITYLFRIDLRQTVEFIAGYLEQVRKSLQVISYSQASRRFKKLNIKINDRRYDKNNIENIEIAIDSASISIYNNTPKHSGVNSKDRKYHYHDQTRKLLKSYNKLGEDGRQLWKRDVNYGNRAYVEVFFWRLKSIFGFSFRNKSEINREKELLLKCYLLNKFTEIGIAKFEIA